MRSCRWYCGVLWRAHQRGNTDAKIVEGFLEYYKKGLFNLRESEEIFIVVFLVDGKDLVM
jgi:hypothetical protein